MDHKPQIKQSPVVVKTRPGVWWTLLVLFWLSMMTTAFAAGEISVVILNSDPTVTKYETFQMEFQKALELSSVDIYMATCQNNTINTEKTITEAMPEIILCIGGKAYLTARKMAPDIPTVFCLGINRARYPLADMTHVISNELSPSAQLTLYRYFFPGIQRMGVIYDKKFNAAWFQLADKEARRLGITLLGTEITNHQDIHRALTTSLKKMDALWLIPDPTVLKGKPQVLEIFKTSHAMKKPIFTYHPVFAPLGATFIVTADIKTMARQAAQTILTLHERREIVVQIQEPAGSHISLNLDMIEALGIQLNRRALSQVNTFIELPVDKKTEQ